MRGSPRFPGPPPPPCRQSPSSPCGRGSSSRSCTSSRDASTKYSGPSPPEDPPHHAQRGHHHAPRARELLRDAARVRFHRHLPVPRQRLHVLSRTPLRERPGPPLSVLHLPSIAVSFPHHGDLEDAVVRGAQVRQHTTPDDPTGGAIGRGAR